MPGLLRKLRVFPSADGLILQPLAGRHQSGTIVGSLLIRYDSHSIEPVHRNYDPEDEEAGIEVYGVIGLLSVSSSSFLLAISQRRQVAQIHNKAIYTVTDVAIIPLVNEAGARKAVAQALTRVRKQSGGHVSSDHPMSASEEDEDEENDVLSDDEIYESDVPTVHGTTGLHIPSTAGIVTHQYRRMSNVAEDVIGRKGLYGRFADRWFSQRGWNMGELKSTIMTDESVATGTISGMDGNAESVQERPVIVPADSAERSDDRAPLGSMNVQDSQRDNITSTLLPKLLRTTRMLFGSGNFFFSYEVDITKSPMATENPASTTSHVPLHQIVDPLFFWNRHILQPFIEGHQDTFVLPLMQGFVGQCTFSAQAASLDHPNAIEEYRAQVGDTIEAENADSIEKREFLLTLISRRSVKRAGLRYLRRGIDDEGYSANTVETEQILSSPTWSESAMTYSIMQIRGSIPLYFSQSPYAFKPAPELQRSEESNHAAMKAHFARLRDRFGHVQVASLVAKTGSEAIIGAEYQRMVSRLNAETGPDNAPVDFEWFDFHEACRGMKFENVSLLMDRLGSKLDSFGHTTILHGQIVGRQSGILRTNCMDCLDRTNVVQSAYGRRALETQLGELGITIDLGVDRSTQWFNALWADNGDAISKQYTSTAALKGDYTRTRKRDYRGALNDIGLSVSRYFNNIVNDYFSQAAMDYLLGNVNNQVFEEFEADLISGDPAISMSKLRQQAIDNSAQLVISDASEVLLGAWTLLTPKESNTRRTFPFLPIVLLLTPVALYTCHFPPSSPLEKPSSFSRIPLLNIRSLQHGAYITSTLANAHTARERNVGLIVTYQQSSEGQGDVIIGINQRVSVPPMGVVKDDDNTSIKPAPMSRQSTGPTLQASGIQPSPAATTSTRTESLIEAPTRIQAFKALPSRSSSTTSKDPSGSNLSPTTTESELVRDICMKIANAANAIRIKRDDSQGEKQVLVVEEKDVIGLAEAKRATGLLEQLGYEIKKLVWA